MSGRARCCARLYRWGGGGGSLWPQRVRFASPRFAPNAPAPRSSTLSLPCKRSLFSVLAGRVPNGRGQRPRSLPPCGTVPSHSRLLGRGLANMQPLGRGAGGGGEGPHLADRVAARAVVVPLPASCTRTLSPFTPRRPCGSLRPPSARSSEEWVVARVAGKQSGH